MGFTKGSADNARTLAVHCAACGQPVTLLYRARTRRTRQTWPCPSPLCDALNGIDVAGAHLQPMAGHFDAETTARLLHEWPLQERRLREIQDVLTVDAHGEAAPDPPGKRIDED